MWCIERESRQNAEVVYFVGARLMMMFARKVRITFGLFGSLLTTSIVSVVGPDFIEVETRAFIVAFSPCLRWPELAIAAAHPQEVLTSLTINSSGPVFVNSKEYSSSGP